MVLNTNKTEQYVNLDLDQVQLSCLKELEENDTLDENIKEACREKLLYRNLVADKFSLIKFNYILGTMMKVFNNKVVIVDPNTYKHKIKSIDKKEQRELRK